MQFWCSASGAAWTWTWRAYPGVWLFVLLLALWCTGSQLDINATSVAFAGVAILLTTGVLSWKNIVTDTGADGMPLATTTTVLAPSSALAGTSKFVDTGVLPVATPMLL